MVDASWHCSAVSRFAGNRNKFESFLDVAMLEMSSPAMNAMYMPTCLFCFQRQLLLSEPLLACFTFPMQGEHSLPKVHMRVGFMRTQRKIVTCVVSISVVHLKPPFICVCVCTCVFLCPQSSFNLFHGFHFVHYSCEFGSACLLCIRAISKCISVSLFFWQASIL